MIHNFRKNKKASRFSSILLKLGIVFICCLILLTAFANIKIYYKRKQLLAQVSNLENKISQIKNQNAGLELQIEKSGDVQYVEKVAREELGLQKPGEKAYSFINENEPKPVEEKKDNNFLESIKNQ